MPKPSFMRLWKALALGLAVLALWQPAPARPMQPGLERLVIHTQRGDITFRVEIADTKATLAEGLMRRESLPRRQGMLFLFGEPQPVSMWMKDTLIPLDMLFIAKGGRITRIETNAAPLSERTINSGEPVTSVLEIGGGESARLGIRPGDTVSHPRLP